MQIWQHISDRRSVQRPVIKLAKDTAKECSAKDFRKSSDFLKQCNTAMKTNHDLRILNDRENKKIMVHLPEWLQNRWRCRVEEIKDNAGVDHCRYLINLPPPNQNHKRKSQRRYEPLRHRSAKHHPKTGMLVL